MAINLLQDFYLYILLVLHISACCLFEIRQREGECVCS